MAKLLAEALAQEDQQKLSDESKRKIQHFKIQAAVDMAKSQIQYISQDIKYMQSIKRFDDEYKSDLQTLKNYRKELNHYIERVRKLFIENIQFEDEILNDFQCMLRKQPAEIMQKYK